MKKHNNRLLNMLAIFVMTSGLCLSGCGGSSSAPDTPKIGGDNASSVDKPADSSATDNQDADTKEYDHSLVAERWGLNKTIDLYYSNGESFEYPITYSIPEIKDDSEDAQAVNGVLSDIFEEYDSRMQAIAANGSALAEDFNSDLDWCSTVYDCYWNGSVASIVIKSVYYYAPDTSYLIYNYDFESHKLLNNSELFASKNMTADEFVDGIRRAAVLNADSDFAHFFKYETPVAPLEGGVLSVDSIDDDVQQMFVVMLKNRANTIYEGNINEYLPVYLDENNDLKAIVDICDLGQYGAHSVALSPVMSDNNYFSVDYEETIVFDKNADGLFLTINDCEWSQYNYSGADIEFGKAYKLDGAYKNYVDAKISWVGNGMQPYILLLAEDGMMSYVDVDMCAFSGCFSVIEPIWGISEIEKIYEEEGHILGQNTDGEIVDVEEPLYMLLTFLYPDFSKDLMGLEDLMQYSVAYSKSGADYEALLGFSEDEYPLFVFEEYELSGEGSRKEGHINWCGMNDKGLILSYYLYDDDYNQTQGSFSFYGYNTWDEFSGDFNKGAFIQYKGGVDLFESGDNLIVCGVSVG